MTTKQFATNFISNIGVEEFIKLGNNAEFKHLESLCKMNNKSHKVLSGLFEWAKTKEGRQYWADIYDKLISNEK